MNHYPSAWRVGKRLPAVGNGTVKGMLAVASTAALLWAGTNSAAVIYDNGATVLNNATVSDVDFPFFLADDFVLQPGANTITDVHWTGVYAFDNIPSATDSFTIQIFADSGGLPATTPLNTFSVGNAVNRTDTGSTCCGAVERFSYSALISPLTLSAGTTYWLSIFNDTSADTIDNWYWAEQDSSGNAASRDDQSSAWLFDFTSPTLDFQLTGDVARVPEPATLALLGIGLAGLGFSRRHKRS